MSNEKKPSKEAIATSEDIIRTFMELGIIVNYLPPHTISRKIAVIIDKHFMAMFMPDDGPMPTYEEMAEFGWGSDMFALEINRVSVSINAAWFKKVKDDGNASGLIPNPLYWINKYLLPVLQKAAPLLTEAQKFNDKLISENRMLKFEAEQRKLKHE